MGNASIINNGHCWGEIPVNIPIIITNDYKAWFTYISQTKSRDFVVPTKICDPDALREDDSQLCSFKIRPAGHTQELEWFDLSEYRWESVQVWFQYQPP